MPKKVVSFGEIMLRLSPPGFQRFPNLKSVAITLRGSLSASHNTWSAIFWHQGTIYTAPKYDIVLIVD
jgi:2-dehydro-3-deoxygluconokinase